MARKNIKRPRLNSRKKRRNRVLIENKARAAELELLGATVLSSGDPLGLGMDPGLLPCLAAVAERRAEQNSGDAQAQQDYQEIKTELEKHEEGAAGEAGNR